MKIYFLAVASLILASACKGDREENMTMSLKNQAKTTYCVGRALITLPASFVESSVTTGIFQSGDAGSESESFDVVVRDGEYTAEKFEAEVQRRRIELKGREDDALNILRLDRKLNDGSALFRVQEIDDAYVSEIRSLRGTSVVTVRLESYHGKYLEAEDKLVKLVSGIQAVDRNNRNFGSLGFCLGPVNLTGSFGLESGSFLYRDGKGSNYGIEINTYAADDETSLLAKMSGPDSLLTQFDVKHKVLRARERVVAGMRAQEWLGWAKISEDPDAKTLKFALDTMRGKPSKATPAINLTYDTAQPLEDGTRTKTVISDDEAMQVWDAVVDSIRPAGV